MKRLEGFTNCHIACLRSSRAFGQSQHDMLKRSKEVNWVEEQREAEDSRSEARAPDKGDLRAQAPSRLGWWWGGGAEAEYRTV